MTPDAGTTPDSAPPTAAPATTGTGTYETNMTDFSMKVADVMVRYETPRLKSDGRYESELNLYLTDWVGRCGDYGTAVVRKNSKYTKLEVNRYATTAAAAELVPGTYVIDDVDAELTRRSFDGTCAVTDATLPFTFASAAVSKIVITSVTSSHVTGSYEVRAPDGRFLKGTFDANLCAATSPMTATTCK